MNSNPGTIFKENIQEAEALIKILSVRSGFLSTSRTILFILFVIGLVYFSSEKELSVVLWLSLIFIIGFTLLVKNHNRINFSLNHQRFLKKINQEEIDRMNHNLESIPEGEEFFNEGHAYSADLDLYGPNSLYQLLNRSGTQGGRSLLSEWLNNPASKETIQKRQDSVRELRSDTSWRQNFQANAMHFKKSSGKIENCLEWMEAGDLIRNNYLIRAAGIVFPLMNLTLIILFLIGEVSYVLPALSYATSLSVFGWVNKKMGDTFKKTAETVDILSSYQLMIQMIEKREFESELLQSLKGNFESEDFHASDAILKLRRIFTALESRSNLLYLMADVLLLLDIFWLIKAENWRKRNKKYVQNWFNAIHEIEVINGISSFAFAHQDYTFPNILERPEIRAMEMGHPLIPSGERVKNDFILDKDRKIGIITGSNMSGKSTFLRTLGVNLVLGYVGAPTCTREMDSGTFLLFTSMRTHDSLKDHVSSFYAELQRLKSLIEYIRESRVSVFFLLDEILKGTNSKDRHNGARSLILQLLEEECRGLVSTHDLELSEIEKEDQRIFNLSFNSILKNEEVLFDYKLSQGVCNSFNATQLMGKMGIKIRE